MTIEEIDRLTAMGKKIRKRISELNSQQALKEFTTKMTQYLRGRGDWTEEMVNEMRAWIPCIYRRTHYRGSPGRKEPAKHAGHGAQKARRDEDG